ncbi:MAG: 1-(5-phosphoribosyl)-5-[(5-phosphoribosylamino)methylideneamino]imidazole-4-carboxamide isomerase [Thermoanaerobacterales bacterium]|nr:1-(5-phosphoribosyl)-5-[(5-phosphoribosylamino)methylideneamino]imidazole-4-carboxamide isomerase [Bacillota bacterium]MDI6906067.1 1-(5-phosphoribosyl)-5-[(5-phosphoribosylamino)methylideneamino]imidazole-4-carboxamide isomerase [Thermoanaerobacterales bacterium]
MLVIPAIDLRSGRCVRLLQGRPDRETVYGNDPAAVARRWEAQGASWLHVVDLDGAFAGLPRNEEAIRAILQTVKIPVQVGGGLRTMAGIRRYLEMGVSRVVLGTAAVADPAFLGEALDAFGERIAVGVDCRDGQVCVEGWGRTANLGLMDFLDRLAAAGARRVIYTDIRRDGMLQGSNIAAVAEVVARTPMRVIASGGVSSLDDIRALANLDPPGVEGVIVGKALYTGAVDLKAALRLAAGEAE